MKTTLIPESEENDTLIALQARYTAQSKRNAARTTSDADLVSQVEHVLKALNDSVNVDMNKREDRTALALSVLALAFTLNLSCLPDEIQCSALEGIWQNMEYKSAMVLQAAKNAMDALFRKTDFQSNLSAPAQKFIHLLEAEPLQNRRSLIALQYLLPKIDSAAIKRYFGDCLFQDLIVLLRDEEVAILVNRIVTNLLLSEPEVKGLTADTATPQVQQAVDAIVANMMSTDGTTSYNTLQHTVPTILKRVPQFYFHLSAVLQAQPPTLLKTKASLSLAESGNLAKLSIRSTLPEELLSSSLIHADSSIRISALGLLVKSASPITLFAPGDFALLKTFWQANLGAHEKDVRQKLLALFKMQLDRFRASSYAADRDSRKNEGSEEKARYVQDVREWLEWLVEEVMWNLSPVAPYRSKITSLGVLAAMLVSNMHVSASTAISWPFLVPLCSEKMTRRLLRCLMSTYEDVQLASFNLLATQFPTPLPGFEHVDKVEEELMRPMRSLMRNVRESEAKSAALLARLLCLKYPVGDESRGDFQKKLLVELIQSAEDQVAFAGKDFGRAAESHPMHGTILAVRQLLPLIPVTAEEGSVIYRRLLKLIEDTWTVTSPLLTNNAEGTVPDHEEARALAMEELGNEDLQDGSATNYKHKSIMSTSWRAMREAGALLEALVRTPFSRSLEQLQAIWKADDVRYIGDLFTRFLLLIRHRGAFSAIAPHYAAFYELVSSCKWPEVNALPSAWLDQRLDDLLSSEKYSITRRSAGLPSCIMALLVGTSPFDQTLLPRAMDRLLAVATDETGFITAHVQIHAMNALRVIFLDSSLKKRIMPYVERGFLLAISRFDSANWAIRNVSLLLYSSLVQRAFSVKRLNPSRSVEAISRRNKTSTFFRTHRSLLPALCNELQRCIDSGMLETREAGQQSSIYSILLLLSLLQTPEPVRYDVENFERLIGLVDSCSQSRIWKIREAAADALVGLLGPDNVIGYIRYLEHLALVPVVEHPGENAAHGALLICVRLLEGLPCSPDLLFHTALTLNAAASYFLNMKRSPALQNAFLEVCCIWHSVATSAPIDLGNIVRQVDSLLSEYLTSYPDALATQTRLIANIIRFLLTQEGSSIQHRVVDLICSSNHAIMASSIDALTDYMTASDLHDLPSPIATALRTILANGLAQGADRAKVIVLLQNVSPLLDTPTEAKIAAMTAEYRQTAIIPLKESLLPAIATSLAANSDSTPNARQQLLHWMAKSGQYDLSETSRLSSIAALQALTPIYTTFTAEEQATCLNNLMQALQDDDEEVRGLAEIVAAHLLQLDTPVQDITAVRLVHEALCAVESASSMESRALTTFVHTIHALPTMDTMLYNIEQPNLYLDGRLAFQLDLQRLQSKNIEIDSARLRPGSKALQAALPTLLTFSADEVWVLAALQYKALARLAGTTDDEAYAIASRIEDS